MEWEGDQSWSDEDLLQRMLESDEEFDEQLGDSDGESEESVMNWHEDEDENSESSQSSGYGSDPEQCSILDSSEEEEEVDNIEDSGLSDAEP